MRNFPSLHLEKKNPGSYKRIRQVTLNNLIYAKHNGLKRLFALIYCPEI